MSGQPGAGSTTGSGLPGSGSPAADSADWAARVAERLPPADVRQLADAAARGVPAVLALRAATASPILRNACDQLASRVAAAEPGYVGGLLADAARAVEQAHRRQAVTVVWTGPESHVTSSRLTAATVIDLIGEARAEILLVSYATQTEPLISAALHNAAGRGVAITLLTERHADNPAYTATSTPFPGLDALRLHWPADSRPPGAALHAKVIVVDDRVALVGSANITGRAMETNLECGILIRGGPQPHAIRNHIADLHAAGYLRRLLWKPVNSHPSVSHGCSLSVGLVDPSPVGCAPQPSSQDYPDTGARSRNHRWLWLADAESLGDLCTDGVPDDPERGTFRDQDRACRLLRPIFSA